MGNITSIMEGSSTLGGWAPVNPSQLTTIADLGQVWLMQANFPLEATPNYYVIQYSWPPQFNY
jgi:hypothetical protein